MNNIKKFNNFDLTEKQIKEKLDFDKELSKDEIISKRSEIANKISELETVLDTPEEMIILDEAEIELQLEQLKKTYSKFQNMAESKVFTHTAIIKK